MKKLLFLTGFLSIIISCFSQTKLFKNLSIDDSTKIICLTDHQDTTSLNFKYTFYCKENYSVSEVLNTFEIGKPTEEIAEEFGVKIYILKGKKIQPIQILVNPKFQNVNTDALGQYNYYSFDTTQLAVVHHKFPISYRAMWLTLETKEDFEAFIIQHQNDSTLLCYEDNTLEYTGTGKILIKKDKIVIDGFKGVSYIETLLKKISPNEEFLVGFVPTKNKELFLFEVQCTRELFNSLVDKKLIKHNWEQHKYELLTYWIN